MAGYIGSKATVSQIDGYVKSEVDTLLGQELNLSGGSMTGNLNFGDNIKIQSGAGSDLQIYHDASNSYIKDAGDGSLRLSASSVEIMKVDTSELMASFAQDAAVTLYHDNAAKLATTSTGIDVTGGIVADHHVNIGTGMSYQWGDSHERIEQSDGKIEFFTGNAERMTLSGNNLGLGITAPTHKLHVNGTVKVTGTQTFDVDSGGGSYIAVSHSGNESWTWDARSGSGSDDYLDVGISGGTRAMSWHETGNVGIGETTPLDMLSISSSAGNAAIRLKRTDTAIVNDDIYGVINFAGDDSDSNASGIRGFIRGKAQGTGGGMKMEFHTAGGGAALVSNPRMTLNADGNLGLGTIVPSGRLSIEGGTATSEASHVTFTNTQGAKTYAIGAGQSGVTNNGFVVRNVTDNSFPLVISDAGAATFAGNVTAGSSTAGVVTVGSANGFEMQKSGTNGYINQSDSGPIIIRMGSGYSEKLRLDASGNLGLGTASPQEKLHIFNSANTWNQYANIRMSTESDTYAAEIGFHRGTSNDNDRGLFLSGNGSTQHVKILHGGNVGIGTTSPNALLHVGGTADTQGSQANPAIQIGSTTGYRLGMYTDAEGGYIENKNGDNGIIFKVKTAGEAMRIDGGTGNVGIAKTSLATWSSGYNALQVGGRGFVGAHTGSDLYLGQNASFNSGWKYEQSVAASMTQHSGGKITHFVAPAGTAGNAISWNTAMDITPEGTTTVSGNYSTTNSVNYVLRLQSSSSGSAVAGHGTGIQFLGERNDGNAQSLALIQAVTSTNSGTSIAADLSFSTGSGGAPSERLRINSSGRQTYNGSSTANGHANFVGEVGSSSKAIMFEHTNGGGECGKIITTSNTAVLSNTSDYRLKENVNYTWDATTRLKQLKPARFNWINDETNTLVDGFLAHEVSSIVPSAVYGEKDGVDEHGNPDWQGIAVTELVPLLVKTIQELEARITELEA